MKILYYLLFLGILMGCAQGKQPLLGDTDWQRQMNADFIDATKSPLKDKDRKDFKTLDFFNFDSLYVVTATLIRTPDEKPFKMKTTTDRLPNYLKYGMVEFELKGRMHRLAVYQDLDLLAESGNEDYLFLPFLDDTNGETTYGGGRYVEASIPKDNILVIDFNKAYNPYCAYNEKYSCPIVPRENYVDDTIEAGVKRFKKE